MGMCVPGVKEAVLVRVPIDGEVEEIGVDPAVVVRSVLPFPGAP